MMLYFKHHQEQITQSLVAGANISKYLAAKLALKYCYQVYRTIMPLSEVSLHNYSSINILRVHLGLLFPTSFQKQILILIL